MRAPTAEDNHRQAYATPRAPSLDSCLRTPYSRLPAPGSLFESSVAFRPVGRAAVFSEGRSGLPGVRRGVGAPRNIIDVVVVIGEVDLVVL